MTKTEQTPEMVKAKLERALHRPEGAIGWAYWDWTGREYAQEYINGQIDWEDLKYYGERLLTLQKNADLERQGLYYPEEPDEVPDENITPDQLVEEVASKGLSNGTKARALALSEYRTLASGLHGDVSQIRPIKSKVRLRHDLVGVSGRWVVLLEVDSWVPPEDVANLYRNIRQNFVNEKDSKTEEGTFELARFVWREQALNDGQRPKWTTLFERWNLQNPSRRFATYNSFRQCCVRGMEATLPRYKEFPDLKPLTGERKEQVSAMKARLLNKLDRFIEKHGDTPIDQALSANP
jgi:hypothetical protein